MAKEQIAEQRTAVAEYAPDTVVYPESDGQPMAESREHRGAILSILLPLEWRYRKDPWVSVDGDMLVYYEKGNERKSFAPDTMVVFGVPDKARKSYKVWVEGKMVQFVAEVSSTTSRDYDRRDKLKLYNEQGVVEFLLFDPVYEVEGHDGRLQLFKRRGGILLPSGPGGAEGSTEELTSDLLGVSFQAKGKRVQIKDLLTGEILRGFEDEKEARRTAERRQAKAERRQAKAERRREAEAERRRTAERERNAEAQKRLVAQARVAELEAKLRAMERAGNRGPHQMGDSAD